MTVIQPNSISGINSITVATGEALQVHAANGDLVSTITTSSGIATYKGIHVGSGTTTSNQGISVGTGCSIVSNTVNQLEIYTNNSERLRIKSDGFLEHYGSGAFQKAGSNYLRIGSTDAGGAILGLDGDSNGDGSGADYCMIKHDTDGHLKIIGDNPANAADIIFYSNSTTERVRIDSSGRLLINHGTSRNVGNIISNTQIEGTDSGASLSICRNSDNSSAPYISLAKSRGGAVGGTTVIQDGDGVGTILFSGADGTDITNNAASISAFIDGSPGGNDTPGRLTFNTTADGGTSPTERFRITNTGAIGINQTNPSKAKLHVVGPGSATSEIIAKFKGGTGADCTARVAIVSGYSDTANDTEGHVFVGSLREGSGNKCTLTLDTYNGSNTDPRVRLTSGGHFKVATTNSDPANDGSSSNPGTCISNSGYVSAARNQGASGKFGRNDDDGIIINLYQDGAAEGNISVSGSTVSYNPFLGCHNGRLSDGSKPTILEGTILETISQSIEWKTATISNVGSASSTVVIPYYGAKTSGTDTVSYGGASYTGTVGFSSKYQPKGNNKHVCVKVSDTASSKAVAGVFISWNSSANDAKENGLDEPYNDIRVGAVGNYFIRMKSGETVAIGDLVESNGDGTGKVQSDDIIRSKTVGKITSTNVIKTYSDGSFLVTVVLDAG